MNHSALPLGAALSALALTMTGANAQLIPQTDNKAPIDITSDTAEFQDELATWTGNVRVVQGEAILTTERLEATLSEEGDFQTITAIGNVRYSNGKEAITGKRGVFNDAARTIVITEDVVVTQGKQVMSAGKITYWIDTGKVIFMPETGKRVRGLFFTGDENKQS